MASIGSIFGSLFGWLLPEQPKIKASKLEDFTVPTAEDGREYGRGYGTFWIVGPNVTWYDDLLPRTQTKNGVKMIRYYLGLHVDWAEGPWDAFLELRASNSQGKLIWEGEVTSSQQILLDKGKLFGGRDKGGGVAGPLDIMMGEDAQVANDYLTGLLGPLPAFKGVVGTVFRRGLVGANSASVTPWVAKGRRILKGWHNDDCWYPEKAPVGTTGLLSYDEYSQAKDGGPAVDYWWKLDTNFAAGNGANYGVAGSADLALLGTKTSAQYNQAPITLSTSDGGSLYRGGGYTNWLNTASLVLGPGVAFTAGVWCNLAGSSQQLLFKSNVGGNQGYWRGLDVYAPGGASTFLNVTLGDGAGGYYRYKSANSSFSAAADHFVVVYCEPDTTVAGTLIKLYIDGEQQTLTYETGSATTVSWPSAASVPSGWTGLSFGATGDTYGLADEGYRDEAFVHLGELTAIQLAEMDRRGRGAYAPGEDMNAAHILYDLHTHPYAGMGWPTAQMDDANYRAAADAFYAEQFGLSFVPASASRRRERIREIEDTVDCVCRMSSTGKFQVVPIRGDYNPLSLTTWTDANIQAIEDNESVGYGELCGRVAVAYTDPVTGKTATTAFVTNPTTIRAQAGVANPAVISYPGIRSAELAARVRDRELRKRSQPLKAFTVLLDRSDVTVERGDVRKISSTRYGYAGVIVRVVAVNRGRLQDRLMRVRVVEDVFGLPSSSYTTPQESLWVEPDSTPSAITVQDALEIPYHWARSALGDAEVATLADTEGFGMPLAKTPQALATGYDLWGRISPADYADISDDQEFFDTATLSTALDQSSTTLAITGSNIDTETVEPGYLLLVWGGTTGEWMRITGGDLTAAITVDRAILDTTPQEHAIGARVWVMPSELLLWDATRYSDGDTVDYKLLTRTSEGTLDIASATAVSVTLDSRLARPYPPAGLTISGEGYPTALSGALTVEWVSRNRLTQYPAMVGQSEATVAAEAGTTYSVYAYDDTTSTLLDSATGLSVLTWTPTISGSRWLRIEVESVRDGLVSWQRQVRVFAYTTTESILDEDDMPILDEDDLPITGE